MLDIKNNVNLKPFNTFGIEASCTFFAEINSVEDFLALLKTDTYKNNLKLIVGGGSNILFTTNFNGLVIKNNLKGITLVSESNDDVIVRAAAGENWHGFVLWCIAKGFYGLENLSLIPGCVGASPMQNIGAYGVEIKDVFNDLEAIDKSTGSKKIFTKAECEFGYRESVFKTKYKDQFLISSVSFKLSKQPSVNTTYGAINSELEAMKVTNPTVKDVSNAVIAIRQSKLPNPAEMGNAGSFFKNPEVSAEKFNSLKTSFEALVAYPLPNGNYKLAAGWLIEQCGLKGFEKDGAAVHSKQALVLINKGNCTGKAVFELSGYVLQKVFDKFGVTLEREVNII
ncbi:MAG: UDP-N-acetylmuramate dehydrogenase [Bacteroidetes bacterium]|nr:UDP-N-acetylmuramate dehydrogenase [Bacteroidota bacterium]